MKPKEYYSADGKIYTEDQLTPELREELGLDDTENDPDDYYEEEYISIDEIARSEGFWIDDDGHWRELEDEDDW